MELEKILIDLVVAIQNNDIEKTKELVISFNEQYATMEPQINVSSLLDIYNIEEYDVDNICIDYVLENLNGLTNGQVALWNRQKHKLLTINDKKQIENFINDQMANKTFDIDDKRFIQGIIQLSVRIGDKDKIIPLMNQLKSLIQSIEE